MDNYKLMGNYEEILSLSPKELLEYLSEEFRINIPLEVNTIDDMNYCSKLLLKASTAYSYLINLSSYAKIKTREIKRTGKKEEYEDMVDRKEVIQNLADTTKQVYNCISRVITIRVENNHELRSLKMM